MKTKRAAGLGLLVSLLPAALFAQSGGGWNQPRTSRVPSTPLASAPARSEWQEPRLPPPGQDALPRPEQLTTFDPRAVRIQRRDTGWTVEAGEVVLKQCGKREEDARQIWHLIRSLGLDGHGVIGGIRPVMEYWLVRGQPPRSLPRGSRVLPIHLDQLRLEKSQNCWVLRENTRVLFNFGPDEGEARQALEVINKYGFDRVGVIGPAVPAMLLFAAVANDAPSPVRQVHHEEKSVPPKQTPPTGNSFYPMPILPPVGAQQPMKKLIEHGHPARHVRGSEQVTGASHVATGRYPFNSGQARLRRENGDWVLAAGSLVLARFGSDERQARLAQAAVMHYRLTELMTVGSPQPAIRYFLSNGQAPRGQMTGAFGERFATEQLEVRQLGDRHYLAQGARTILDCGTRNEDAQHLLQVFRRLGIDQVLRFGSGERECLTILVRSY